MSEFEPMMRNAKRHTLKNLAKIQNQKQRNDVSYSKWLEKLRASHNSVCEKKNQNDLQHMRNSIKLKGILKKPYIQGELLRQRSSRV